MAGPSTSTSNPTTSNSQTSGSTSPVSSASSNSPQDIAGNQAGRDVNVTADPQITGQAFDAISALVSQALAGQNQTAQLVSDSNGQNNNQLNAVLADVLARDQAIGSNTATGGASGTQTTFLWLAGIAVAGVIAFAALFRKKS